jgi:hypothetical protein
MVYELFEPESTVEVDRFRIDGMNDNNLNADLSRYSRAGSPACSLIHAFISSTPQSKTSLPG